MAGKTDNVKTVSEGDLIIPVDETPEEQRRRILSQVVELDDAIHDYKPVSWLVDGLIPQGSLVLLSGEPKLARKSILSMYLSLCVATGQPFLGRDVQKGSVLFANLEDGYERTVRRYYHYGVRPNVPAGKIYLLKGSGNLDYIEEFSRVIKPAIVVVDPVVELELMSGVQDENDAREVAKMLKRIRDLAQETGTVTFAVHHHNKTGDVRGSTAFKGSVDGWFEIHYRRDKPRILRWTLRDAPEGEADVNIEYEDDVARVELVGEFRDHHTSASSGARSGGSSSSSSESSWTSRKAEAGEKVRRVLSSSQESFSINQIAKRTGSNKRTVKSILEQFEEDGVVRRDGLKWLYNPVPSELPL